MMDIYIAEPGMMTQSGSSLLRLIQNNDMPLLDLLVRESIQNSLDAYRDGGGFVTVDFQTGIFNSSRFIRHLDSISDTMSERFPAKKYPFLAIKDSGTVGLTGPIDYDHLIDVVKDGVTQTEYGNLLKLVYEICKPQENTGAGGSWGLGKTVYFRVGIGMVLYYSRIKTDDCKFASRLAISMVEDENSARPIIPRVNGKARRGIAWWGEGYNSNKIRPIQNEKEIAGILDIFGVSVYSGVETGTTIIIPYIDQDQLLKDNQSEYDIQPYWLSKMEDYLEIAIQRWYAPRLNNEKYKYGPYLKVNVNNKACTCKEEPFFKLVQDLYNYAADSSGDATESYNNCIINIRKISPRDLLVTADAGRLAYVKVSKEDLDELPPNNKSNPFVYSNCERVKPDENQPIVLFCRRQGMVVSYETTGKWVQGIQPSTKDEYIIGFFVLNSSITFRDNVVNNMQLEEYVRRCELADHASWNDITLKDAGNPNPKIIHKIRTLISSKIAATYHDKPVDTVGRPNMGLGKFFGELLLPPINYGGQPSASPQGGGGGSIVSSGKSFKLRIDSGAIRYNPDSTIEFPFQMEVADADADKVYHITSEIAGDVANNISVTEWETMTNSRLPFRFCKVLINELGSGKQLDQCSGSLDGKTDHLVMDNFTITKLKTSGGSWYGIGILSSINRGYTIKGMLVMTSTNRTVKTSFSMTPGR